MRKKRIKIILVALLVLLAMPNVQHFSNYGRDGIGWQFMNFYYMENRHGTGYEEIEDWVCFDALPVPKYSYGYESMFFDISRDYDYCEPWDTIQGNNNFSIFIGVQDWMLDLYFPVFWLSMWK